LLARPGGIEEVKKMREAETFAEEDKTREHIEARNEADGVVHSTEKALKDYGDKVSQEDRRAVERALSDAKDALKNGEADRIKRTKEELLKASYKLAQEMYKEAAAKARDQKQNGK
jgi:molecular chaperone DnaK